MTQVKYDGTSDFQIFTKADFEKAGVDDQGKVTFAKGEPTEVSEAAAAALLSSDADESIFHDFVFSEVEEDEEPRGEGEADLDEEDAPPLPKGAVDKKAEAADTSGSTSSDTTGGSTGAGTSTRGGARSGRGSRSTGGSTT